MNDQLKIAQMNTKAVIQKLTDYEARHAEQEKRISVAEAKVAQLEQRLNVALQMIATPGSGPTA